MARLTKTEVENRSLSVGIKMIGTYIKSNIKTLFRCPRCLNGFMSIPSDIWRKHTTKCQQCAHNVIITQHEAKKRFLQKGLVLLDKYSSSKSIVKTQCYCGIIFFTKPNSVFTENTKSCGCHQKQRVSKCSKGNVLNQRFGNLKVLFEDKEYKLDQKNQQIYWRCLCDCGNQCSVTTASLNYGCVKSCGNCKLFRNGVLTSFKALELHKMIGEGIHNYTTDVLGNVKNINVDIAIPEEKIAIEYDEEYWHKDRRDKDQDQTDKLIKSGWKVIRIFAKRNLPTKQQMDDALSIVRNTNQTLIKIQL